MLEQLGTFLRILTAYLQGQYDMVWPMGTAWEPHRRWPEANLHIIQNVGHSAAEPSIATKLVEATERFKP